MQWIVIVDDLDGGAGLMANKIKVLRLRAMAVCFWVPIFVGSLWGECSIGSGTKLFEKKFSHLEVRNKTILKIPGF